MRHRAARWLAAALAASALAASAAAPQRADAVTLPLTLSERASLAANVVVARVGPPVAVAKDGGVIRRHALTLDRVLKGDAPTTIALLGGVAGSRRQWVSDQPELTAGTTYVLFLDELGRAIGGPQGAVPVSGGRLARSDATVGDLAEVLAVQTLTPQQSRAFPELRAPDTRAALNEGLDAAFETATQATAAVSPAEPPSPAAPAGPVITAVSPEAVSANSGSVVEVQGTGFGTTPGSVKLTYDPSSGKDPRTGVDLSSWPADLVSWSDTRLAFRAPVFIDGTGYPGAAGSGDLTVTTSAGKTAVGRLTVTYALDGMSWPSGPIPVWINPAGALDSAASLSMMQTAISTWSASGFPLYYAGQTGMTVRTLGLDATTARPNGLNEVGWNSLPAGILAQTSWWPGASANSVGEEHIVFNTLYNTTSYRWGDGTGATFDVQSIALHEFGHWIVLRDQYGPGDKSDVMYGYGDPTQRKRMLTESEVEAIRRVYGPDQLAPITSWAATSSATPDAPYAGSWTSGTVTYTISPPTADVGWKATRYRIDYGAAQSIGSPTEVVFDAEGLHDVMAWSTDNAGNNERPVHKAVAIDRTAPVTSSDATSTYGGQATVHFSATDALSGVARTDWRIAGDSSWTTGSSATVSTLGSTMIEYRSADRAGNVETPQYVTFDVLPLQPAELTLGTTARNVTYGTVVSIEGTLTTAGAALEGQTVRVQTSATGTTWANGPSQVTGVGGRVSIPVRLSSTTYYRLWYPGLVGPAAAYASPPPTPAVKIGSTASLGVPSASRVRTRTYDLWATMMPRHPAGTYPVRLYLERRVNGRWVPIQSKYVLARASNVGTSSTKALRRYTFPAAGTWRMRAYHADSGHLATRSGYRTFTVR